MISRIVVAGIRSRFLVAIAGLVMLVQCSSRASGDELLISGFFSDSVGRYDASSGTFIGNFDPGSGLDGALAARVGADGLLYVASEVSNQIKRYNVSTGAFVDNFVTGGVEGLNGPSGITWDSSGDLLVSSFNSDSVLKYNGSTGTFIETVVTSGSGGLNGPDNGTIVGPDGKLYVPSYFTNQIIRYDLTTGTPEVFINGILRPRVLVFQDDQLYITSEFADAVRRYDLDGSFVDNFIQPGSAILDEPVGLEFFNDSWFVSSASMDKVLQFDADGALVNANFISTGSGGLDGPVFITGVSAIPEPSGLLPFVLAVIALALVRVRQRPRTGVNLLTRVC